MKPATHKPFLSLSFFHASLSLFNKDTNSDLSLTRFFSLFTQISLSLGSFSRRSLMHHQWFQTLVPVISLFSSFFVIDNNDIVDNVKAKISLDSFFFASSFCHGLIISWLDLILLYIFDLISYVDLISFSFSR